MGARDGGLLAVGDSLVNGYTGGMPGIPGRSFPQWVAETAEIPCVRYGHGGSGSEAIVTDLVAHLEGDYRFGVLSMGTTDAWRGDPSSLDLNVRSALRLLLERCDRVAILSVQYSAAADRAVRAVAADLDLPVIDATLRGLRLVSPDLMHPTALGQVTLADRTAETWGLQLPSEALDIGRGSTRAAARWWPVRATARARRA